jgi:hypothetical protein
MIACPSWDCEWREISIHDSAYECMRNQRIAERIRKAIGYWNDPIRFECSKIDPALH